MPSTPASDSYRVREAATAQLKLRADLRITPQELGGRPCYLIEDPLCGKFFRLGVAEYTRISLWDGRRTIAEAVRLTAAQLGPRAFTEQEALSIAQWLVETQLATTPESATAERLVTAAGSATLRRVAAAFNPLAIRIRLFNPDRWLEAALPWCGWLLSWPVAVVWLIAILLGLWTAALNWEQLANRSAIVFDPGNWFRLAVAWTGLKLIHESFHALACKKFGGNVVRAGVMFLFFAPVAYTDVTSSWRFRSKWQRIVTAAAGMYVELFVAALAVVTWSRTDDGLLHRWAYDVALMASLGTVLFNINPLMRFDGYYMLSDLVGVPNLYSRGRQAVGNLLKRHGLGLTTARPDESPATARLILAYGLAALVWLAVVYFGLALLAIAWLSYLGATLVAAFMILGIGIPAWRSLRETLRKGSLDRHWRGRLARAGLVGAAAVALLGAWLLSRPGRVEAPAVVEYGGLAEIRAAAPGFVREVHAQAGDFVEQGQIIAVLDNPDLSTELASLRLESTQATAKIRGYLATDDLAKAQIETANRDALEKRVAELTRQLDSLTIRSPARGHLVGRQLRSLVGQYLKPGTEIALVGDESAKELIVAVGQDDLESFRAQLGAPVRIRWPGAAGENGPWELVRIDPQANLVAPHVALTSRAGGSLLVKVRLSQPSLETGEAAQHDELLRPCFKATVRVPSGDAAGFRAGQRATVGFSSPLETTGSRLWRQLHEWVRERIGRVPTASEPAA